MIMTKSTFSYFVGGKETTYDDVISTVEDVPGEVGELTSADISVGVTEMKAELERLKLLTNRFAFTIKFKSGSVLYVLCCSRLSG